MATGNPVTLSAEWSEVQVGAFSGGLQNLGNTPVVARIEATIDGEPAEGAGGFSVPSIPIPVSTGTTETLWCRVVGGVGSVILA